MWWEPVLHEALKPWAEELFKGFIVRVRRAKEKALEEGLYKEGALFRAIESCVGASATLLDVLRFVSRSREGYRARSNVVCMLASETAMAFYIDPETDPLAIEAIDFEADKARKSGDNWLAESLNEAFRDVVGLDHSRV